MKLILRYCRELIHTYPLLFAKAIAMILLITALNTAIPCGMRYYIDAVTANGSILMILAGLLLFAACMLLGTCLEIRWYIQLDEMGGRYITDITIDADQLSGLVTLKEISAGLARRIRKNYISIIGLNSCLILLGVSGLIQPTASALAYNMSTLLISLNSMKDLLADKKLDIYKKNDYS